MKGKGLLTLFGATFLVLILVALPFMTACAKPAPAKALELDFAVFFPAKDYRSVAAQHWADTVEQRTNGRIKITVYPGGALLPLPETWPALVSGAVDIAQSPSAYWDKTVTEVQIFSLAGAFHEKKKAEINNKLTPLLGEVFAKHNMKYIYAPYEGEILFEATKPLEKLADIKGLMFRDYGPVPGRLIKELGGISMTIPLGELPVALERGTVDGAFFGWPTMYSMKTYELAPYVLMPGGNSLLFATFITMGVWNQISKDDQRIIMEAGKEAAELSVELGLEFQDKVMPEMKAAGLKVRELDAADMATYAKAVAVVKAEIEAAATPLGKKILKELEPYAVK